IASAPSFTFSAPVRSGRSAALTPSSIGFAEVSTVPEVGASRPASTRSRVDFPEPLRPMIPMNSPDRAVKEIPRTAATETVWRRRRRAARFFGGVRSVRGTVYRTRTSWATRVSGEVSGATQGPDVVSEVSAAALSVLAAWWFSAVIAVLRLSVPERQEPDDQQSDRPAAEDQPRAERGRGVVDQRSAVQLQHVEDRVDLD